MLEIVAIEERYIEEFHAALDSVARERRYLARAKAPPIERTREFVRNNIETGNPQLVALDGEHVIGWCDVIRNTGEFNTHSGSLGMGLLPNYRRRGLGRDLLRATLAKTWPLHFARVELEVFADNTRAISLYELNGFEREGVMKRAACIDGVFRDVHVMAILNGEAAGL
jgi:RimJ/RimL family protein N-acetyltransferase